MIFILFISVFNTEKELIAKVTDAISGTVNPGVEKFAAPHLTKVTDILASPVSFQEALIVSCLDVVLVPRCLCGSSEGVQQES